MSKAKEIRALETTGQGLYKARKFAEALDTFNKAVVLAQKWSPSDVLDLLDQRVVIHKHVGNIDLARKDAKSMIRVNKADARGYLRCAQLDRSKDPSAALRWCEHGLNHAAENDSWRPILVAQRDKVEALIHQKIMASKAKDPLSILPAEIFQHLLSYLDFRETVKILRVSKAWMGTVSRLKLLSDTIDFSGARCTINYKMMVAAFKRLAANPKKLIMTQLSGPAEALLLKNLERWHKYTQLEMLTISPNVISIGTPPFARYNLRSLDVEGGEIGGITILEILKECRSLEVGRFRQARGSLGFSGSVDNLYPRLCRTLRSLHLGGKRYDNRVGWERYTARVDVSQKNVPYVEVII
jgi:tetratricopeptide (TPR) repeat protein